jgi:hypothetical protein
MPPIPVLCLGIECFSGSSAVETPSGPLLISDLKLGHSVLTHRPGFGPVFTEVSFQSLPFILTLDVRERFAPLTLFAVRGSAGGLWPPGTAWLVSPPPTGGCAGRPGERSGSSWDVQVTQEDDQDPVGMNFFPTVEWSDQKLPLLFI